MNLQPLSTICFTLSVICIVLGSSLAISMIWMEHTPEFLWKSWSTITVVFFASTMTLIVSRVFGRKEQTAAG